MAPPLYEYNCPVHGVIEQWQGINDRPLTHCPIEGIVECGCRVKKLISLTAGAVIEPKGMYQPLPGLDAHGKTNEEKISPREYARRDNEQRKRMLATRAFAKKGGLTPVVG